jgi:UDP-N-acetylglucosamine acyltransferase
MSNIHPTAIVSPGAELAPGVTIGPYSIIGGGVSIAADTTVGPHVHIEGNTTIGERNQISPFVCIGTPPQDISYQGEDTRVIIGHDNVIREYVTIHRASTKEKWETVVGNSNFIMAYVHIAHDCVLGNEIIISSTVGLSGHTHVGDHANIGGLTGVHQFVHIGAYAFIGGLSGVAQDVPPYMIASGSRATLYGVNQKGLARKGFSKEIISDLKKAYKIIWRDNKRLETVIQQVKQEIAPSPELDLLLDFLHMSKRGVIR